VCVLRRWVLSYYPEGLVSERPRWGKHEISHRSACEFPMMHAEERRDWRSGVIEGVEIMRSTQIPSR